MSENTELEQARAIAAFRELMKADHWELPTNPDPNLSEAVKSEIQARLIASGVDEYEAETLAIGIKEAFDNAIYHGNLGLKSKDDLKGTQVLTDKKVNMDVSISPGNARFVIEDEGEGFDWQNQKPVDMSDPLALMDMKGRGTEFYIKPYFDIERNEKGNQITLTKKK